MKRWRARLSIALGGFVALLPALAAAHLTGVYRTYIENPAAAIAELNERIATLERQIVELEAQAAAAAGRYEQQRQRAVAVVRFYDAFLFEFATYLLAGSADVVDLLSQLRVLERVLARQAEELDRLSRLHQANLAARAELLEHREALAARQRLVRLFAEAQRQREEFWAAHPDPLWAELALQHQWLSDAPLALRLLEHVEAILRDGRSLFEPADAVGLAERGWVLTETALRQRLLPLPPDLSPSVQELDVFIMADHVYWAVRHDDRLTLLITRLEPDGEGHLRLVMEHALYRGVALPESHLEAFNQARPLLIDVRALGSDPTSLRQEDGYVWLGAPPGSA